MPILQELLQQELLQQEPLNPISPKETTPQIGQTLPNGARIIDKKHTTVLCLWIKNTPEYIIWDLDENNNCHSGAYHTSLEKAITQFQQRNQK
jgi:hypothetical protein